MISINLWHSRASRALPTSRSGVLLPEDDLYIVNAKEDNVGVDFPFLDDPSSEYSSFI